MNKVYVGIDVSQAELEVAVRPSGASWTTTNDAAGCAKLAARLLALQPERIVVEDTGGLERLLVTALDEVELPIVVANPRHVRAFAEAAGRLAKTDHLDAGDLAHYGEALQPELRALPDMATQEVAALLARRRQLVTDRTAERNPLAHSLAMCAQAH